MVKRKKLKMKFKWRAAAVEYVVNPEYTCEEHGRPNSSLCITEPGGNPQWYHGCVEWMEKLCALKNAQDLRDQLDRAMIMFKLQGGVE
jgi:hypothetical protein